MEYLITFQQFKNKLKEYESEKVKEKELNRFKELAGIKKSNIYVSQYLIQITLKIPDILLEHEQYKNFKKSTNRYTYHPEEVNPPVKAHFHIFPSKSKKEIYAVNVIDGTAHHKKNRGYTIPKKEADELRALGVTIDPSNILESRRLNINESNANKFLTFYITIEEEEE